MFYQVYPKSFADGNGDGLGDLIGLRDRLDYLQQLGVDALWLSPFYTSPGADGGYDVANPTDVDPIFGTIADFDALVAAAHARGIRVTIDLVPNHFSHQHPWFQEALAAEPGSRQRARFIFRDGQGPRGDLRRTTGRPCSAARPGLASRTVSGTYICSRLSNRISIGPTPR